MSCLIYRILITCVGVEYGELFHKIWLVFLWTEYEWKYSMQVKLFIQSWCNRLKALLLSLSYAHCFYPLLFFHSSLLLPLFSPSTLIDHHSEGGSHYPWWFEAILGHDWSAVVLAGRLLHQIWSIWKGLEIILHLTHSLLSSPNLLAQSLFSSSPPHSLPPSPSSPHS